MIVHIVPRGVKDKMPFPGAEKVKCHFQGEKGQGPRCEGQTGEKQTKCEVGVSNFKV